jgi:hypothetical protein
VPLFLKQQCDQTLGMAGGMGAGGAGRAAGHPGRGGALAGGPAARTGGRRCQPVGRLSDAGHPACQVPLAPGAASFRTFVTLSYVRKCYHGPL